MKEVHLEVIISQDQAGINVIIVRVSGSEPNRVEIINSRFIGNRGTPVDLVSGQIAVHIQGCRFEFNIPRMTEEATGVNHLGTNLLLEDSIFNENFGVAFKVFSFLEQVHVKNTAFHNGFEFGMCLVY